MDWQQVIALSIVALTAGLFLWNRLRRRRLAFKDTHCGCAGGGGHGSPQQGSIIFRASKGQRPEVVVKMR